MLDHCSQPKYVCSVELMQPGDLVFWDNTCVMWVVSLFEAVPRLMGG